MTWCDASMGVRHKLISDMQMFRNDAWNTTCRESRASIFYIRLFLWTAFVTLTCGTVVFVNMEKTEWGSTAVAVVDVKKKKRQAIKLSAASHRRVKFNFCFDAFIMIKRDETGYAKTPIKLITKLYLSVFLGWIYAENHFAVLHCPLRWQP